MTKFPLLACSALLLLAGSTFAGNAQAQTAYDVKKTTLKAVRFETISELKATAKNYLGKYVELRGQVKGSFSRNENMAILFQVADNETIIIEVPDELRNATATRPGANSRLLCRVESSLSTDVALSIAAATDAQEAPQLFRVEDDDDLVVVPATSGNLPTPDRILIGPDANLKASKTPVIRKGQPAALPSRSMNATPNRRTTTNPYFGFGASERTAFKNLARRTNPKLGDDTADYIAASILSAAQTHNLDPRFLAAVVKVESSFDPYCLSSAGAMGLGQLMPFNLKPLGVGNAWDPMQNLHGSAKMLRKNLDTYSNQKNGTLLAVAAYHAGVGAVNRAGKAVPPKASTQKYVWKVYYAYKALAPELF